VIMENGIQHISRFYSGQYELVRGSREVLFDYCRGISPEHLLAVNPSFGRGGSIRNLLVHIANTYEFWLGRMALKKEFEFTAYESITSIGDTARLFEGTDSLVFEFLEWLEKDEPAEVRYSISGTVGSAPPFKIFSHVITHEYHHKGQILSMGRHLGYLPIDTDIMR